MRRLLIVALLALALYAAGFLAVRSTVEGVRPAAEARLSALLGQPVSIGGVRVSVFPVPAVIGSEIRVGSEHEAPDLDLQRVRIIPRLRSLFGGPYVIREVTLEGLTVRVVREPPGRWRFPAVMPAPGSDSAQQIVIERVRLSGGRVRVWQVTAQGELRETSSIDEVDGEAVAEGAGLRISPIRGRVGRAEISGESAINAHEARLDFTMPAIAGGDLGAVLGLAGADPPASVKLAKPATASMSIRIDRQSFRLAGTGSLRAPELLVDTIRLHGFEAPVRTDGVHLTFEPAVFTMYGGTHRGKGDIDLSKGRWSLDGTVGNVNVGDFLRDFTAGNQHIDGTASVVSALRGRIGDPIPRGLEGRMQVNVVNGVVREFPLLNAINRALRLAETEGRETRFERLTATLMFAGPAVDAGHATTNDLVLQARDVRVEATGRIGFDRSLDLAGLAVLSPERAAGAIRSIRELSGLRNDRGELELPITITGRIDDPSFAIDVSAAIARSLKEELRRRLRGLFRR